MEKRTQATINLETSRKIKELRKQNRIKQTEIAEILGVSNGRVSQLESGSASLTARQAQRLAAYYNVSLDYLCGNEISGSDNILARYGDVKFTAAEVASIYNFVDFLLWQREGKR